MNESLCVPTDFSLVLKAGRRGKVGEGSLVDHGWLSSRCGSNMSRNLPLQDKPNLLVSILLLYSQERIGIPANPPV